MLESCDLFTLVYVSAEKSVFDDEALETLLDSARERNRRLGVTGVLVRIDRGFLQLLEGPPANVLALFDRISADRRHAQVTRLIARPAPRRLFEGWAMACTDARRIGAISPLDARLHLIAVEPPQDIAAVFDAFWRIYARAA